MESCIHIYLGRSIHPLSIADMRKQILQSCKLTGFLHTNRNSTGETNNLAKNNHRYYGISTRTEGGRELWLTYDSVKHNFSLPCPPARPPRAQLSRPRPPSAQQALPPSCPALQDGEVVCTIYSRHIN
jgi:hypothetical protein